ncbi:phosphodiesterase, partial [Pseudomonas sp. GW247-3R2A]
FAEADGKLLGMNTRDSLQKVIELVRLQQPQIDLIVASGDLSQDGTLESYQLFRDLTRQLDAPTRWIPGNHDEPRIMAEAAVQS